ncbi:hypothetical protein J5O04_02895 [Corynebacterium hindlerae]|uniref:hypothetical protein n=1 Tax=Corynebacterium hindlerae TaxID=699041 RepID=UPI001AD7AEE3|nr:hypothetical protein [Corynebacterium hindlerae]QTH60098.1 hypothetical protein J5O04_02895 [Corynebacterium hindlerae]
MTKISPAGDSMEHEVLEVIRRVARASYENTPYNPSNGRLVFDFDRSEVTGTMGGFWLKANKMTVVHVARNQWSLSWEVVCGLKSGQYVVQRDGHLIGLVDGHEVTGHTVADLLYNAAVVVAEGCDN